MAQMIGQLKRKLIGVGIGGISIAAVYFYWQHVTGERDAYQAEAEHQRNRAEILIEHQQLQRQRIETLSNALAKRERTLNTIDDDIGASTGALEPLGEQDAKAGDWLDSDLPDGVVDWVRELQRSGNATGVRQSGGSGASNQ
ncbi:hypothetical protein HALTITAN_0876 [Vreelandella titanicae BH1]|uniref:Uncharacterized protein n=2 Tax=Vreelandella titanicae TaxID=664683 RepID=L9UBG1_9GAMM|nr:hypothetical protein HALTITAN_0876 [Halomonas titanicae BH1]